MRPSFVASAGTASLLVMLLLGSAFAAEIKVMYPPPMRTVLSELIPQFENRSGHKVAPVNELIAFLASPAAAAVIRAKGLEPM